MLAPIDAGEDERITDLESSVRRILRDEAARVLRTVPPTDGPTFSYAGDARLADLERLRRPAKTLRRYEEQLRLHLYPLRSAAAAQHDDPHVAMPLTLMIDVILGAGGLRLDEMFGPRLGDVDLAGGVPSIVVTGTIVQVRRDSRAWEQGLHLRSVPKTSTSRRRVPIPAWLANQLRPVEQPDGLVLRTRGGDPYSPANVHSRWRAAAAAAGTPGLGPHDPRKYAGTLIAESHNVDTTLKVLGHASVQVTERRYVARAARTSSAGQEVRAK